MASAKAIKKRRKTTKNIRKITKTMELVSTAKLKGAKQKVRTFEEYEGKLEETMFRITDGNTNHSLVIPKEKVEKVALFVIAANKGLCGSYNTKVIDATKKLRKKYDEEGKQLDIFMAGRKGILGLKFHKIHPDHELQVSDHPTMNEVAPVVDDLIRKFERGEYDEVRVIYTRATKVKEHLLLPFTCPTGSGQDDADRYICKPDKDKILDNLLPLFVKVKVFGMFLQSVVSEQTSRMLAMKSATENADQMIKDLTREYNRARQNQITKEMLEILAGADAIS